MKPSHPTTTRLVQQAKAVVDFEEDPHRAALEDNPDIVQVSPSTWAAIFFLALSFGPPIGLGFLATASIVVQVTSDLDGIDQLAWVVGAWSLASAVSFSLAGPLSDVFGRRMPMLVGESVTILGCIVAAVAHNISTLIAAETLIGLGTGVVFVAYAGVPEMLPNKWRSLGLAILEAGIALPWGMISAVLGNALNKYASWRWIFYIGIIVEAIALAGTVLFYWPTPRPRGDFDKSRWDEFREIDFVGLILFVGGLTTFLIGLTWGGTSSHSWNSASCIVPIIIGFLGLVACLTYDFKIAKSPMFPLTLFTRWRQYTLLLAILFISGMNFYSMAALLPQGSLYMFTADGLQIGIFALPNTIMQGIAGVLFPMFAHNIGHIKWQLIFALVLQATFIAATAASVYPNQKLAYIFLPAFGVPMFIWVTILSYVIASLHVPHSKLGVAMGLLGTFRGAGGAVGNAVFDTIFVNRFNNYGPSAIAETALRHGLNASNLPEIIQGTIEYNVGVPDALNHIPGMTTVIQSALRTSVRGAYGHALKIVFYVTIPFSIIAIICAVFVEDPTIYMTNHVQFAMDKEIFTKRTGEGIPDTNDSEMAFHVENATIPPEKAIATGKH